MSQSPKPIRGPATLLALDPSSKCCGYAVFRDGKLAEHGRLTPRRSRDDANSRIVAMLSELEDLLNENPGAHIVCEDTSGKVGRRRHGGGGAGLAVHGKAVGAFWHACLSHGAKHSAPVFMVLENDWTASTPKATRTARIAAAYKQYDPKQDPGGDAADAIGLGTWWLMIGQHRRATA